MERYVEVRSLDEVAEDEIVEAYHGDLGMKNYTFKKTGPRAEKAIEDAKAGLCRLLVWREVPSAKAAVLPEKEDKKRICALLLPVLQATRNLFDLATLEYDEQREVVIATFENGYSKTANVAADSGTSMIKDILKQIL